MEPVEPNPSFQMFAEAAEHHAWAIHKTRLDDKSIAAIDRILATESLELDSDSRESLVLCYGAWIGQWMVRNLAGTWVGLHEPTPPRICVSGNYYSPMDAVERLLSASPSNASKLMTIDELINETLNSKSQTSDTQTIQATQKNQQAWNTNLASDLRFVRTDNFPQTRLDAIAAIDPWIRDEISKEGIRVLCLAAGGGTHGPLLAIAGAQVTIVDFSSAQLAIDLQIAKQLRLEMQLIESSMDDLSQLSSSSFDLVVQPVSMCYSPHLMKIYSEVARVLRPHGLYVAQHKSPTALQAEYQWLDSHGYSIRTTNGDGHLLPEVSQPTPLREQGTQEYFHSLDRLIGGLCETGFVIEGFSEPIRGDTWAPKGSFEHRSNFLTPYLKIKARRQSH